MKLQHSKVHGQNFYKQTSRKILHTEVNNSKLWTIEYLFVSKSSICCFLLYYSYMLNTGRKLGAFIVPTGVGASIGGYAGDASVKARKFASVCNLIVNPNVVNAGGFSGITPDMLYVEGYSLNNFFKGNICLTPSANNKIGVVFDRAIPQDVLNVHLNTINAVKTVYGIDVTDYEITDESAGVDFYLDSNGVSTGSIKRPETLLAAAKKLIAKGVQTIAVVCMFKDPEEDNTSYADGIGTDPVGGVEAIISHYLSKELMVPCAHSPAFEDYSISSKLVDAKSASEYITPTFLPCILLGLAQAPLLTLNEGISIDMLDFLIMPYNCAGSIPVFEAVKRNIDVYLIKENVTALDVTPEKLGLNRGIITFETYQDCYDFLQM